MFIKDLMHIDVNFCGFSSLVSYLIVDLGFPILKGIADQADELTSTDLNLIASTCKFGDLHQITTFSF